MVVVYNGIEVGQGPHEAVDSLSVIHLGEHLERLTSQDLRRLDTQVPLETLRAVVDLALEIGREGREGHPVGTMFVVGDTRKVLTMSRPMNFNPFRGYSHDERDVRDPAVREQIKDIAQLEGAIVIRRDGVAVAACMRIEAPDKDITLSMGLGTRHAAAASISKCTKAVAVVVSQSSGSVRIFQNGTVVLHIEPLARPMTWGQPRLDAQDGNGIIRGAPGARRAGRGTQFFLKGRTSHAADERGGHGDCWPLRWCWRVVLQEGRGREDRLHRRRRSQEVDGRSAKERSQADRDGPVRGRSP